MRRDATAERSLDGDGRVYAYDREGGGVDDLAMPKHDRLDGGVEERRGRMSGPKVESSLERNSEAVSEMNLINARGRETRSSSVRPFRGGRGCAKKTSRDDTS